MSEKFDIKGTDNAFLFCGINSNFKNVLHLEGELNRVWIYQREKSSIPGDVYHRQTYEIALCHCVNIEKMVELIELYRDEIQEILDSYSGHWNGSNNIGSFDDELTEPLRRNIESDGSYQVEYSYEDPHDFIYEAWTFLHDFTGEYPKPKDGNYLELAERIISDTDTGEIYLNFDSKELAEFLDENEDVWETEE